MHLPFVHEMFAAAVQQYPDAIAIEQGQRRWTYAELKRRSQTIAFALNSLPAANKRVCILFGEDRAFFIAAMLGALQARWAFVPVLSSLPDGRISLLLEQCEADAAVVEQRVLERFRELSPSIRARTVVAPETGFLSSEIPTGGSAAPLWNPDDLAYIFFTSGSAGTPKAIAGRMKSIDHFIRWETERFAIGPGSRVSQLCSPMFDAVLRDVFAPLSTGGTVCIPPEPAIVTDGPGLLDWLDSAGIHIAHMVPSVFRQMLGSASKERCPALRYILLAGESLLPSDVREWNLHGGDRTRLVNLYGPSETTMTKFVYEVAPEDEFRRSIPIGKPIPGAAAAVLDSNGKICPAGVTGEIYIKTPFSSLGYYRKPELTSQVFLPDPLDPRSETLVYRTGDYGRVSEDGNFEFVGRRDDQVKIHGVRIELREIEAILAGCPGVRQVAAIDRKDADGDSYLCAYVVASREVDEKAVREYGRGLLPDYMSPKAYVLLESLPLTGNGKLDRAALPAPEVTGARPPYQAPDGPEEEVLAAVFSQVLKVDGIGRHEDFFDLSGHSLMATQVISRVREAFGVDLPLRTLFETPTVAALAERIKEARRVGCRQLPVISRGANGSHPPLSFSQQRLWFLQQLDPRSSAYNMPFGLRLCGELDRHALTASLREILRRHEVLRSAFSDNEGVPVQTISPNVDPQLAELDLRDLPQGRIRDEVDRHVAAQASEPFDLVRGPVVRGELLRTGEREHVLLVTLHHIVCDAWSVAILARELSRLYTSFSLSGENPLTDLKIQYADFAVWQRNALEQGWLEDQVAYWRSRLAGLEVSELPSDFPRDSRGVGRTGRVAFRIGPDLMQQVRELAKRESVTLFMVLAAAVRIALGHHRQRDDIVIGTAVANRTRVAVEDLIGCFANTLPLRVRSAPGDTFRELLSETRKATLDAYEKQDLPFEMLVRMVQPERYLSRAPLFHIMLVLHNVEPGNLELAGLTVFPIKTETVQPKFELTLIANETDDALECSLEYAADLFEHGNMVLFSRMIEAVLRSAAGSVHTRVSTLYRDLETVRDRHEAERWSHMHEASLKVLHAGRRQAEAAGRT